VGWERDKKIVEGGFGIGIWCNREYQGLICCEKKARKGDSQDLRK